MPNKSAKPKKKRPTFEIVPLAEVLRLEEVAKNLRVLSDDAQDRADTANRRANTAQHKAVKARGSRKEDVNQTAARIVRESTTDK